MFPRNEIFLVLVFKTPNFRDLGNNETEDPMIIGKSGTKNNKGRKNDFGGINNPFRYTLRNISS